MQIFANYANYVAKNTTKTIHSKAGKLRAILVTGDAVGTVILYDNTSGSGAVLLVLDVMVAQPQLISFDILTPLTFATGLTIVTSANARCFVITEA
jgi:hypothetical protein